MRLWIVHLLLGFSSGIPLLLTGSTLQVWMTECKIDLKTIGAFALVGLPYNLKFLWSPFMDRYTLPFLTRRRGWMLLSQLVLALAIICLGCSNPLDSVLTTAILCILVSFVSASQDTLIDAYRRETLSVEQMGYGLSLYVAGYRVGMLVAGAFALLIADRYHLSWSLIYTIVACFLGLGIVGTLWAPENRDSVNAAPQTLKEAVFDPFVDFFSHRGVYWILAFLLLYKLGDNLSSAMTAPFVIQHGFSKTEYAAAVKGVGLTSTLIGGFVGAWVLAKIGLNRSLWVFGILQALAILTLMGLALVEKNLVMLGVAIAAETFTAGMAVPAFGAFIAFLTNKKFTATQYALLNSLVAIPRTLASAPSGWIAAHLGWPGYFLFCALMAIPGMILLARLSPWDNSKKASEALIHLHK